MPFFFTIPSPTRLTSPRQKSRTVKHSRPITLHHGQSRFLGQSPNHQNHARPYSSRRSWTGSILPRAATHASRPCSSRRRRTDAPAHRDDARPCCSRRRAAVLPCSSSHGRTCSRAPGRLALRRNARTSHGHTCSRAPGRPCRLPSCDVTRRPLLLSTTSHGRPFSSSPRHLALRDCRLALLPGFGSATSGARSCISVHQWIFGRLSLMFLTGRRTYL